MSPSDPTTLYGLTALPASVDALKPTNTQPSSVPISSLAPPASALAERVSAYCRSKLPQDTFAHSMRVYTYGLAIARECFPDWNVTPGSKLEETWFCTAMLHDIGTTDEHMPSTKLSYEFWAGVKALDLLQNGEGVATKEQAESVAEAIFRHQDVQDKGKVTLVTQLIQLGTLMDNIGGNGELIARGTIESVVGNWPRKGWSGCFRGTVEKEKELKPWAMVSRIEGFEEKIVGNKLMSEWD